MPAFDLPQAPWRKSSYSGGSEGGSNCVEAASSGGSVRVRDSKDPGNGSLAVSPDRWRAFLTALKEAGFTVY
ncbi:MAG TPA: DUF397 domain-containing protein [Streptosporangiaceae bacterium]|jgi:hypothetical protein